MTRAACDRQETVPVHAPRKGDQPTFACGECGKPSPVKGRTRRRVRRGMARGLVAYVCASCSEVQA